MSPASYALRFATGFDGMMMVSSGMSDMAQMQDNLSFMKDFQPLSTKEQEAVKQVTEIFKSKNFIPCIACRYCIAIPDLFACLNAKKVYGDWNSDYYYS